MTPEEKLAIIKEELFRMKQKSWWKRFLYFIMLKIWGYIVADAGK